MDVNSSSSSSLSRTLSNRNPKKRPIGDDVTSAFNLEHLDIPEQKYLFTHNFDFLDEVNEPEPVSPTLSPRTITLRNFVVTNTNVRGRELFGSNIAFSHSSIYSDRPIDWGNVHG